VGEEPGPFGTYVGDDARLAQDRDERGQHQLAADPDGGGQDVQEEADGVPADGEHPVIFPPVRLVPPGSYGSENRHGDRANWQLGVRNINTLR